MMNTFHHGSTHPPPPTPLMSGHHPNTGLTLIKTQRSYLLLRSKGWSSEEQGCHNRHIQDIFPYSHTDASLWLQRDGQRDK